MFYVDSETNNIYITKGDTAALEIDLFLDDVPYIMQTGDKLCFAVKAGSDFNYTLFSKEVETNRIEFYSADTFGLSAITAEYSITLIYAGGSRDTFLSGKFNIMGVCYGETE